MKIALVSEHASPLAVLGGVDAGGQNVHVAALASALARRGAHVTVHTRRDSPELPRRVPLAPGVVVDHVDAGPASLLPKDALLPHMAAFAADLHRQWTRPGQRPDLVHAHFWMSGLAARQAAVPLGIPVVQTFHALGVVKRRHQGSKDTSPAARLAIEQTLAEQADLVVATCSDELFELVRLGAPRDRISVVPCGVDVATFTPHGPAEPTGPYPSRIVVIGRLVERKGIGNVITALAAVPGTELVVAGGPDRSDLADDPEARRLRELADRVGVGDRVQFRGRVGRADLPPLLRSAQVAVCVPWYEPFGIVPLEAMACGVPVVASAVGGLVDTVVDGVTGIHVPPRCPAAVAQALRLLLGDAQLSARLGHAGAARARSRYAWDRIAAATEAAYQSVAPTLVPALEGTS